MKIVVTTPTGHVGSHVVRLLVQAGVRPTVLLRDPERLDTGLRDQVDSVKADQTDEAAVIEATKDADALYWVNPDGTDPDPIAAYTRLGAVAAQAVRTNDIGHVVFQSSVGAEARGGFGEIDGLAATEQLLDETGAAVTHLRCGYFFTNLLLDPDALQEGVLRTTMPIDAPMGWVDPRDIGHVAAARLLGRAWTGRVVQAVHGPRDLTFEQVATIVSEVTGRPFRAEQITDEQLAAGLRSAGLPEPTIDAIVGMGAGFRGDFTPEQVRDATTTTPSGLAGWAHEHLRTT
ncbi:NAD(P)H-binding protein [Luteipulveratus mongoliensis]|uniref:NmrA family transcriptional regulator n=1 Tax=Luteipulveratus mongoliensis TaxID=571913 RepID=A0A0K1JFD2_9MICO|nr:NAD(P)H-binding protein [Luteipulveratus mongoliensis]AKU15432.1 NmrA family transcriptional regulator [Luteipulveratus mongoliensis]